MDVVELGGVRLHILAAHPGLPGEGDRVTRALTRLAPAVILGDIDTDDALRLRTALGEKKPFEPGFIDTLFQDETRRRYAPDTIPGEHPLASAARYARDRRAEFIPLRPSSEKLSFLTRRRATRHARNAEANSPEALPHAFADALAPDWTPDPDVAAAQTRLIRALEQGRAPIVIVVQAHRRAAYEDAILATRRIPA